MLSFPFARLRPFVAALVPAALLLNPGLSAASLIVLPDGYSSTLGDGSSPSLTGTALRIVQLQVAASLLGGLQVGDQLTGMSFRGETGTSALSYADYEIRLAQAANAIGSLSTTLANNLLNPVLVRDGALSFAANAFTAGAWGPVISFTTPYTYQGGDLIWEIRHTTSTGTNVSVDTITSINFGSTLATVAGTGSMTATTGSVNSLPFFIAQFTVVPAAVPAPATLPLAACALVGLVAARRRHSLTAPTL